MTDEFETYESGVFGKESKIVRKVDFAVDQSFRAVQAHTSDLDKFYSIKFHDKKNKIISVFGSLNSGYYSKTHQLRENEEIIGVYGWKNKISSYLTAFGFIVKAREN